MKIASHQPLVSSIAGRGCLLFTAMLALLPSPVTAQCPQGWDVRNGWRIKQGPTNVDLDLRQNGIAITGTARYFAAAGKRESGLTGKFGEAAHTVRGTVDGTVQGNEFKMHVYWDNNRTGVYNGTIRPTGRIEGTVYGKDAPSIKVDWYSDTNMPCAPAPRDAATPIPHSAGVKVTGKAKLPAATPTPVGVLPGTHGPIIQMIPSTPAPQTPAAPVISARPSTVTIPAGQTQGTSLLIWDGGKDHPYAEIWVKVDDQDETKVLEAGKGTRQVKVEAGKTYLYILTDSGQRLATVTVKAK